MEKLEIYSFLRLKYKLRGCDMEIVAGKEV